MQCNAQTNRAKTLADLPRCPATRCTHAHGPSSPQSRAPKLFSPQLLVRHRILAPPSAHVNVSSVSSQCASHFGGESRSVLTCGAEPSRLLLLVSAFASTAPRDHRHLSTCPRLHFNSGLVPSRATCASRSQAYQRSTHCHHLHSTQGPVSPLLSTVDRLVANSSRPSQRPSLVPAIPFHSSSHPSSCPSFFPIATFSGSVDAYCIPLIITSDVCCPV